MGLRPGREDAGSSWDAYPNVKLTDRVDQVLADPDITGVAIATPAVTHGELVQRALLAGKDVFVEKPLSLSVDEAQKLNDLASDKRLVSWWAIFSGTILPCSN